MYEKYQIKSTFSRKYWVSVGVGVFESTPLLRIGPFECFVHILGGPGTTAHCTALETFEPGKITPSKNIFSLLMIIKYAWLKTQGRLCFQQKVNWHAFRTFSFWATSKKMHTTAKSKENSAHLHLYLKFQNIWGL